MTNYIGLIHKDAGSDYGVSFPDIPGVVAAGDTLDDAIEDAARTLAFAAEDWAELTGTTFPAPSTFEALLRDRDFAGSTAEVVIVAIPLATGLQQAA